MWWGKGRRRRWCYDYVPNPKVIGGGDAIFAIIPGQPKQLLLHSVFLSVNIHVVGSLLGPVQHWCRALMWCITML